MNIFINHRSFLNDFFRSIPFTLPFIVGAFFIFSNDPYLFYFVCGMIICQLFSPYIKHIFTFIELNIIKYNHNDIPIIGRFIRPQGANNCGSFYKSPDNISTTSGMPSGHSILAGFTSIYLYYYLIDKYKIKKQYHDILLIICLLFTVYTMYTRILFNCHTIQQTIIGAIIGMIYGYYYYIFINKILQKNKIRY